MERYSKAISWDKKKKKNRKPLMKTLGHSNLFCLKEIVTDFWINHLVKDDRVISKGSEPSV